MTRSSVSKVAAVAVLIVVGATLTFPIPAVAGDSPGTARILSVFLPGAGHIYAGEGVKGVEMLGFYAGALTLALATNPGTWEEKDEDSLFDIAEPTPTSTKVIFWTSAAAAGITWLYGVIDAPKAVKRRLALVPTVELDGPGLAAHVSF
jgi:hypothetical protein